MSPAESSFVKCLRDFWRSSIEERRLGGFLLLISGEVRWLVGRGDMLGRDNGPSRLLVFVLLEPL